MGHEGSDRMIRVLHGWKTVAVVDSVEAARAVARLLGQNDPFDDPFGPVWTTGGPPQPDSTVVSYTEIRDWSTYLARLRQINEPVAQSEP